MDIKLDPVEARVLGSLIEKEMATPEYYPLSLNALTNACNQKSNRDPVLNLGESEVQAALDRLVKMNLASRRTDFGARVAKYGHRLAGTLTRSYDFGARELAILCELLVRGPQTPGELRAHAGRLHAMDDVSDAEHTLARLRDYAHGPYVAELPRQPGRRESRWACLFAEVPETVTTSDETPARADATQARLQALEEKVEALAQEVAGLRARLDEGVG